MNRKTKYALIKYTKYPFQEDFILGEIMDENTSLERLLKENDKEFMIDSDYEQDTCLYYIVAKVSNVKSYNKAKIDEILHYFDRNGNLQTEQENQEYIKNSGNTKINFYTTEDILMIGDVMDIEDGISDMMNDTEDGLTENGRKLWESYDFSQGYGSKSHQLSFIEDLDNCKDLRYNEQENYDIMFLVNLHKYDQENIKHAIRHGAKSVKAFVIQSDLFETHDPDFYDTTYETNNYTCILNNKMYFLDIEDAYSIYVAVTGRSKVHGMRPKYNYRKLK